MKISIAIAILYMTISMAPCVANENYAQMEIPLSITSEDDNSTSQEIWIVEKEGKDIYFNLRDEDLGRDFAVFSTAGVAEREWQLLRWVKRDHKIILLTLSGREDELLPDWTEAAVVGGEFPLLKQGGEYRINVTPLFGRAFPFGWGRSDGRTVGSLGGLGSPKVFPRNVVIRSVSEIRVGIAKPTPVRWNFIRLPENRMPKRGVSDASAFLPRGGWLAKHNFPQRKLANEVVMRWRLEGKGSLASPTFPHSPIYIYVDPSTPERWKKWVAAGIESWQPAFERIGYRQAVRAVIPESTDIVDYDDIRRSVLCWKSKDRGCYGDVFDPRTGEILQFHMSGQDHALEGYVARYAVALAVVDQRALETPLPDAFFGALIQRVSAHETGHILGLRDGDYGALSYSSSQIRQSAWVRANGMSPSIMNYARFNYLAQPEDGMPADLLSNRVGPADEFWIRWGYGRDPQDVIHRIWNSSPLYRYRHQDGLPDPYEFNETPGVSDTLEGVRLGMRNLEGSMAMLERHVFRESDPQIAGLLDARSLHKAALNHWFNMHKQLLSRVGGRFFAPDESNSWTEIDPISGAFRNPSGEEVDPREQKEVVELLCKAFFSSAPEFLVSGPIVQAAGLDKQAVEALVMTKREALYRDLMDVGRLNQMVRFNGEFERGKKSYSVVNLMRDMQSCVVR